MDFASLRNGNAHLVKQRVDAALSAFRGRLDSCQDAASLDDAFLALVNSVQPLAFLKEVAVEEDLRNAARTAHEALASETQSLLSSQRVYALFKAAVDDGDCAGDAWRAAAARRWVRDCELRGASALSGPERQRAQELERRISQVESECQRNIADDATETALSEEELEGVGSAFLEGLERDEHGRYRVTLRYPHLLPILRFCRRRATRERMWRLNASRAPANASLLPQLTALRLERAALHGCDSNTEFRLGHAQRMVRAEEVDDLLHGVWKRLEAKRVAEREADLRVTGLQELAPWDVAFAHNLVQAELGIDQHAIREYLPLETVLQGTFDFYSDVLDLTYAPDAQAESVAWHPQVRSWLVRSKSGGDDAPPLARIYLDLHARAGKFSHAACFWLSKRDCHGGIPTACVVCNFTAPTPTRPALLLFSEAKTLFHEFGHLMHASLAQPTWSVLGWDWQSVEMDFLEVPSMACEKFIYEALPKLSRHFERGDPLPSADIARLKRAQNLFEGYHWSRLIALASFDLAIHGGAPLPPVSEWNQLYADLTRRYTGVVAPSLPAWQSWTHPVQGYDSGYMSYLVSEIVAVDLYKHFDGAKFRVLLERCSSMTAREMIRDFLGRDHSIEPFIECIYSAE